MIQLDTSFLIRALVPRSREDGLLREWLAAGQSLRIATIAWAEFLCGPVPPEAVALARQLVQEPLPFGASEAEGAARLFNHSGRRRGSLVDCMIAATAIEQDAQLATSNSADFRRFSTLGLALAG